MVDTVFFWLYNIQDWGGGGFLLFQMKPETLDLSYKTDLDFLDCFRRVN